MRCLTCCKCGRCSWDTSENTTSQCCRVQAVATLLSICHCVAGEWSLGDFFQIILWVFLCVCVCLTVQTKNFPWLWFSQTELLKYFLKGKPAARTDRGESVWVVQTVLQQKGKWIDLDGDAAGRALGEPAGQDWTTTPSPALRGAGENCTICKRLPKVPCQSDQSKLQPKPRLPQSTAKGILLPPMSKISPYKFLFPHTFGQSLTSWPDTLPGAQPSLDQELALQPRTPGAKWRAQRVLLGPILVTSSSPSQHPYLHSHTCRAFAFWPPQHHSTVPSYTKN